jgi:hypothetical protein
MKAPNSEKRKGATPVILIDEEQDIVNTLIIGQMLSAGKESTS